MADAVDRPAPTAFKRVLVTGGGGFVGSYLVPALSDWLGTQVVVAADRHVMPGATNQVLLDLADPASIYKAVREVRPDLVVHLAGQSSVVGSRLAATDTWSVNFAGSMVLAQALAVCCPKATLLFASSAEIYGESFNQGVVDERTPPRPTSPYARSKCAAEYMFGDVLPDTSRLIVARPSNHSGPGQSDGFVIPAFASQIARAEQNDPATIHVGQLDSYRDFLDVRDVVRAYLTLLDSVIKLPPRTVVNIAAGNAIRIGDILDRLVGMAARPVVIVRDPSRLRSSEIARTSISSNYIRALGWAPSVPLDTTLANTLAWERRRLAAISDGLA